MTDRNVNLGDPLTRRETQIRELVCEGLRTKIIARKLQISPRTVDAH